MKSEVRAQSNTVGRLRFFWGGNAREYPGVSSAFCKDITEPVEVRNAINKMAIIEQKPVMFIMFIPRKIFFRVSPIDNEIFIIVMSLLYPTAPVMMSQIIRP